MPREKLDRYRAHRLHRERRLLDALAAGKRGVDELLDDVWDDAPSELRTGAAIRLARPERVTISTKVGWKLTPSRQDVVTPVGVFAEVPPLECRPAYDYDDVMREVEDSLQRLGMNKIDILFIHDVDHRLAAGAGVVG